MKFTVVEIFKSLQGEGLDVGRECIFIRFSGCNRACSWCDTDWSKGEVKTLQELLKEIEELNCSYVVLTGGEPMLQEGIKALTTALFSKGYEIAIETNGTVYKEDLFVDLMAISPKLSSSGREFNEYDELISLIHDYPSFLKFVISDEKDMKEAKRIIETLYNIDLLPEIVFQPEFESGDFNALPKMAEKVLGELYNEVYIRFLPQIHKLVGVR